jgi:hypothetical protein
MKWYVETEATDDRNTPEARMQFAGTQSWGKVAILLFSPSGQVDPDDSLYQGFLLDENIALQIAQKMNDANVVPQEISNG